MSTENRFTQILPSEYQQYPSAFKQFILYQFAKIFHFVKPHLKWNNIKLIVICLFIAIIYLFFSKKSSSIHKKHPSDSSNFNQNKYNAFILTADCASHNFDKTKTIIEVAFPSLFSFSCVSFVPLSNPRINTINLNQPKIDSSNVLTFLDLWTYKIAEESKTNEYQWSFIFEDDVNFIDANSLSLPNYISPLQQLMTNPEIQHKHGFFYLGMCRSSFDNGTSPLIYNNTGKPLFSQKGCGFCRHATAITAKRAELFWAEISSYRPIPEATIDVILYEYCVRSHNHFYTFGANLQDSTKPNQAGVAYKNST